MKKLLCWLDFHKWLYSADKFTRECKRCGKKQTYTQEGISGFASGSYE
jgi:hypothetical protein